jgi:hypothetical protein
MNVRVPLTNIQTPQFITIRLYIPPTKDRVASTVPFFNQLKFVGIAQGITEFSRTQRREVSRIYGFNGNEMQPMWLVPHSIETSLRLKRIVFHETDLLQELGFIRGNLLTQENPFVVIEDQYKLTPAELSGGKFEWTWNRLETKQPKVTKWDVTLARSIVYHDCWLLNNNIEYNIMSDNLILIPEFEVSVGTMVTSEETGAKLLGEVATQLFKSVSKIFGF